MYVGIVCMYMRVNIHKYIIYNIMKYNIIYAQVLLPNGGYDHLKRFCFHVLLVVCLIAALRLNIYILQQLAPN